ncbi:MAG: sulfoxide reductase heme-binding subunit YedZ [Gammaproteobacteria bacterium]|nr:MAG: sulfoxide reductase heme-binding subunit YedZ [Gammaproteobacteria bacterium]
MIDFSLRDRPLRLVLFILLLVPAVMLVYRLFTGDLGANPIETLTDDTGRWALRLLLLSLAITPLRWLTKSARPLRFRRMIGLYAWFYAGLHVTIYVALDQQFDPVAIGADIVERPYIAAGMVAFLILVLLGVSSNRLAMRRLKRAWQPLHRWSYVAAVAVIVHYVWLAKGDIVDPWVYAAILCGLLMWRMVRLMSIDDPGCG